MYEQFYGLRERPFNLTPDPGYLYLTPKHSEALAHLEYGLASCKGITVLIGEVGTGKTTLLHAALRRRALTSRIAHVSNPTLTHHEFYELLASEFRLSDAAAASKAQFLRELKQVVNADHDAGGVTALVIDEAQSLPTDLLEEVRLLANFETETEKLLSVILVGQPELADRLNDASLRQLKQRIALRCTLGPLDLRETAAYIAGRIRIAGGDAARLFTRDAVVDIFESSLGLPRVISVICDNALVTGFAEGVRPVDRRIVADVCRDFGFSAAKPDAALGADSADGNDENNEHDKSDENVTTAANVSEIHSSRLDGRGGSNKIFRRRDTTKYSLLLGRRP
jgi:general secretion pathway protein A